MQSVRLQYSFFFLFQNECCGIEVPGDWYKKFDLNISSSCYYDYSNKDLNLVPCLKDMKLSYNLTLVLMIASCSVALVVEVSKALTLNIYYVLRLKCYDNQKDSIWFISLFKTYFCMFILPLSCIIGSMKHLRVFFSCTLSPNILFDHAVQCTLSRDIVVTQGRQSSCLSCELATENAFETVVVVPQTYDTCYVTSVSSLCVQCTCQCS